MQLRDHVLNEIKRVKSNNGEIPLNETEQELLPTIEVLDWTRVSRQVNLYEFPLKASNNEQIQVKTPMECKIQWTVHQHPYINTQPFLPAEIEQLDQVAAQYNYRNWVKIAQEH